MWEPGWSAPTWDDFTRVALAQEWADDPFLAIGDLVWLPIQTWGYGIAFALVPLNRVLRHPPVRHSHRRTDLQVHEK